MTDLSWLAALAATHLWHSVALAGVLALTLIASRRLAGNARYALCVFAMLAAVALPAIALTPGSNLINRLLTTVNAPITFTPAISAQSDFETMAQAAPVRVPAIAFGGVDSLGGSLGAEAATSWTMPALPAVHSASLDAPLRSASFAPEAVSFETAAQSSPSFISGMVVTAGNGLSSVTSLLPDLTLFFLAAWLVGTLVLLTKTARDLAASMQMVSNARTIALPKSLADQFKGVRVALSDQAPGPIAAGVFRPCIILPVGFEANLDRPGMVALLEHERAHVERNDMLVALGQRLVLALLWWSPAMHWISRRMDEEREVACDEAAVERTGDARAFALTLTHQAESQLWASAPRLAVGAIGTRSQFGRRISRLVDLARNAGDQTAQPGGAGRLAFAGLALVALAAAVLTPGVPATAQDTPEGEPDSRFGPKHTIVLAKADQTSPKPPATPAPPVPPTSIAPPAPPMPPRPEDLESIELFANSMANWGLDISGLVTDQVLAELPDLLEEIFVSLEEAGIGDEEFSSDWREEILDLKEELRRELGPEVRIRIQREIEDARQQRFRDRDRANADRNQAFAHARADMERELARARAEIQQALSTNAASTRYSAEERSRIREDVQEALDEAFQQLQEARESGEFDFDIDFDFENEFEEELEGRGPRAGDFQKESDFENSRELSGPKVGPEGGEDHAGVRSTTLQRASGSDCPKKV